MDITDERLKELLLWAYDENNRLDPEMVLSILKHEKVSWTVTSLNNLLEEMEDRLWAMRTQAA